VKITAIVTTAAMFCSIPHFRTPKWRWARATLFCAIGWSGAFPMTHAAQTWGIEQANRQMGWWYFICEGLCYISGAIIYAVSAKCHDYIQDFNADLKCSFVYLRDYDPVGSTYGAARIRSSMCVLWRVRHSTCWGCSRRSITTMIQ
jgi:predicted membrane channel-forming protein YqfA (hemolysin III family)